MKKEKPIWKSAKQGGGKSKFDSLVTDAFLLALISGAGYACAFMYDLAYARHFGVPIYFISPNSSTIAFALFSSITLALLFSPLVGLLDMFFLDASLPRLRAKMSMLFICAALNVALYGLSLKFLEMMLACIVLIAGTYLLSLFEGSGNLSQRLQHAEKRRDIHTETDIVAKGLTRLGPTSIRIYGFALLAVVVSIGAGAASARWQKDYHLLREMPGFALLKRYGDVYIFVKYDLRNKKVLEEFVVLKDEEIKRMTLTNQRIGPLECAVCLR